MQRRLLLGSGGGEIKETGDGERERRPGALRRSFDRKNQTKPEKPMGGAAMLTIINQRDTVVVENGTPSFFLNSRDRDTVLFPKYFSSYNNNKN
jgi:hypothetical protein